MSTPASTATGAGAPGEATVRVVHWAFRVPGQPVPFDTGHARIHYPAIYSGTDLERDTGVVPADEAQVPYPVAVIFPGVNVGMECYRWLAVALAEAGIAAVTFDWVGELFPGQYGLTPGVDVAAMTPDTFGTAPVTSALAPLLASLEVPFGHTGPGRAEGLAATPLDGHLDLSRVALLGHSAGGSIALLAADHRWFPQVRAAVAYGAHTGASTLLGWPPATVLPLTGDCPVLLIGGTADGVIAHSAYRYGESRDGRLDPLARTFETMPAGPARDASRHLVVEGGNHFSLGHPEDDTSARGFLDGEAGRPGAELRAEVADEVIGFCVTHLMNGR